MSQKGRDILKKQKKVYGALLVGAILLVLGVSYFLTGSPKYAPHFQPPKNIDLPADKMNPQDIWMSRVESQNKVLDQRLQYIESLFLERKQHEEKMEKEKGDLKGEIGLLKQQLNTRPPPSQDPIFQTPESKAFSTPVVETTMGELPAQKVKHVDKVIPSGTTVKALLVSSVDADCGVYSSSDPIPVKLRLLDDGHLPKGVDVHLKGGVIIGSAFGNLSSERIYMRLERLTQVKSNGTFVETEITGYVTGEDGKYGVRGIVVDKSEKIVANAALSGLFAETSQILQSTLGRYTIDNYLSTNQGSATLSPGAFNSTSNAFNMLADYYVKRAEQVKPVIQVNAGRIVDVTFTFGTEVGDLHTQDKVRSIRDQYQGKP